MLEKRPTLGKAKRLKTETTIRRADGTTWQFPLDNPDPIEIAKALKRRAAARSGLTDDAPRTTDDIRERMRRGLAARGDVEPTPTALPGAWNLDIQ